MSVVVMKTRKSQLYNIFTSCPPFSKILVLDTKRYVSFDSNTRTKYVQTGHLFSTEKLQKLSKLLFCPKRKSILHVIDSTKHQNADDDKSPQCFVHLFI
jgi:hypothetical protein